MFSFAQKTTLFVLTIFIWSSSNIFASVVVLNSGKIIENDITYRDEELIKIDSGYGIDITYYLDEVKSIDGKSPSIPSEESVEVHEPDRNGETIGKVEDAVGEEKVEHLEPVTIEQIKNAGMDEKIEVLEPITIEMKPKKDPIEVDRSIEESELGEEVNLGSEVEPLEKIEDIEIEEKIETSEPIVIKEVKSPEEKKSIGEVKPVRDIHVIEDQAQAKELPSPFGPTIRENKVDATSISPIVLKYIKPVPRPQMTDEPQKITLPQQSMSDKIVTNIERFAEKQKNNFYIYKSRFQKKNTFIQRKLERIPVKIRRDILGIGSLVFVFFYAILCFPLMWIAKKINRKHAWLVWVPVVQIFYLLYLGGKPLWWIIFFLIPVVNIILPLVLFISILRELKKSYWLIIPVLFPGFNVFVLWYLALSGTQKD